jgi:hypothetical protein
MFLYSVGVNGNWLYTPLFITASSTPVSRKANQYLIHFESGKYVVQISAVLTELPIRVGVYSAVIITLIAIFYSNNMFIIEFAFSCHGF